MYTQNDLNIIKTQANSFVNDQLKWQRQRIEALEKKIEEQNKEIQDLKLVIVYGNKFNLINTQ
tara:strand:- start:635 stop:823 length:189 start_codon:yes stop_codon:yes gene_type:complete